MLTQRKMLLFALESLRAAERTPDPRQHDILLGVARSWLNTANAIEDRAGVGKIENSGGRRSTSH
jgi:hypothetical protein